MIEDYDEEEIIELTPEEIALSKVRIKVTYKGMTLTDISALYLKSVLHSGSGNRQEWNSTDDLSFSVEFKP